MKDFATVEWDAESEEDCRQIVRLAMREELHRGYDWTTVAMVPAESRGAADVVARQAGVLSGLAAAKVLFEASNVDVTLQAFLADGQPVQASQKIATISGSARDLLTMERTLLNLLGRMSGIATLASRYVAAVAGTRARIYDTRKTTPGWRRLEKYAVKCGGGHNHRTGLYDAILVKDNHLAHWRKVHPHQPLGHAVEQCRRFLAETASQQYVIQNLIVEIEVDTLEQLREVLAADPDIVLLDNMSCEQLATAVQMRNTLRPQTELEASGGVSLETIAAIAATGVDRISVGALTHSAKCLDIGLDWCEAPMA